MKRILGILLLVTMLFGTIGMLVACKDDPEPGTTTQDPGTGGSQATTTTKPTTKVIAGGDQTTTTKKADEPDKPAQATTIGTKEELLAWAKSVSASNNYAGKTVKLTADIYLNDIQDIQSDSGESVAWYNGKNLTEWKPVEGFAGTFDGQGHAIYGVYLSVSADDQNGGNFSAGFFGPISGGTVTIQNLAILNSYYKMNRTGATERNGGYVAKTNAYFAGLVPQVQGGANLTITSCLMDIKFDLYSNSPCMSDNSSSIRAGGFIGMILSRATVSIDNCAFLGSFHGTKTAVPNGTDGKPLYNIGKNADGENINTIQCGLIYHCDWGASKISVTNTIAVPKFVDPEVTFDGAFIKEANDSNTTRVATNNFGTTIAGTGKMTAGNIPLSTRKAANEMLGDALKDLGDGWTMVEGKLPVAKVFTDAHKDGFDDFTYAPEVSPTEPEDPEA